jgi:uncharacterized repeat protein (TIGR03803 family)
MTLMAASWPLATRAEPWPRERHGPLGSYLVVHDFSASNTTPGNPVGTSVIGPDGAYYGVSANGGPSSEGTIYRMNADRSVTTLHVFGGDDAGRDPGAGMTLGSDGWLYGTTSVGGLFGGGVIYRLGTDGSFTVMHAFGGVPEEGRYLNTRLVEGLDGNFYGNTGAGGAHHNGSFFRMSPAGEVTVLRSLSGGPHEPYGGGNFCVGPDGYFYAMGRTTAYRIAPDGSAATVIHRFDPATEGTAGRAGLIIGSDGQLYGAMAEGGRLQGGTLFRLSPTGKLAILHDFHGPGDATYSGQAYAPTAPLMQAADGSLYGTAMWGGHWGRGGVYRLSPDASFSQLLFAGSPEGDTQDPTGALVQTPDGHLLGTGYGGGIGSPRTGTIYALTPAP